MQEFIWYSTFLNQFLVLPFDGFGSIFEDDRVLKFSQCFGDYKLRAPYIEYICPIEETGRSSLHYEAFLLTAEEIKEENRLFDEYEKEERKRKREIRAVLKKEREEDRKEGARLEREFERIEIHHSRPKPKHIAT